MNKTERKKIYKKAVKKWSYRLQLNMLMEECAELIQATSKVLRKGDEDNSVWRNLVEEIADVEIMIEQIKLTTDYQKLVERVETAKYDKLRRLKKRIEQEKIK